MAYLHCHTKGCGWSQDDFWDFSFGRRGYKKILFWYWRYNPISLFLSYVFGQSNLSIKHAYIIPRRIRYGKEILYDRPEFGRNNPHSWWLIYYEFKRMIRKYKKQKWWTYESFKKDKNAVCPNCGQRNFDID